MKTYLTAAVLTLSTILSLGSAILLTLSTIRIISPSLDLYTLVIYLIAASPSYFIMKTLLEILKPPTVALKSEGELIVKEIVQKVQEIDSGSNQVDEKSASAKEVMQQIDSTKVTQTKEEIKAEVPKQEDKEEKQDREEVAVADTKPEPTKAQPTEVSKEESYDTQKVFTPLLDELKSVRDELNGLKVRLKVLREKSKEN